MNKNRIIIAVDGPAGAGKSSVCKDAALRTGLKYIDSGAVYRAITLFLLEKEGKIEKGVDYSLKIRDLNITQIFNKDGESSTFLNDRDVSGQIRNEIITKNIGIVSDDTGIRNFVNSLLRKWSSSESIIMDGRDIGSVVFPDADIKIYLDASVEERALRRYREYQDKGKNVDITDIRKQIAIRDKQDQERPFGRLIRSEDAIYIDTDKLTQEEVTRKIVMLIGL
ncbi:MAG: (d)CMP kinase [Spirochaetes bacterium]|jgi:cytidylate kinase|nr:(d)CMP kinase [Spirochaetota bacterium]